MGRTPIWTSIAATLEQDIASGHYDVGDKLPTEAALARRFGVNRHTVRRALGDMAARGIVHARRGSGVFVEAPPTDYPIGKRVRFHQNIRATGRLPEKQVLRLEVRPCDAAEAAALSLSAGAPVVVYEGLSLSGGAPIAHFMSVFSEAQLPGMLETLGSITSVTEALKANGIQDYLRADTRVSAERANATQALHLRVREGDPLLRTVARNTTLEGAPLEHGVTWFAGDRVTLTLSTE